ncbi:MULTISPECIES: hypothetical protein [Marinobacter]|uniref:Uncharacterized protein n=1 Tax=Marinobacter vinifirmus TaxID=355591 RepID=A0A558BEZ2_9GAMM|nr:MULTISPECIES: hypothetical protein [Marinobacter]TVT35068.1 MAG: hypothetical protein FHK81_04130 [Marinobacter vinifirmus]
MTKRDAVRIGLFLEWIPVVSDACRGVFIKVNRRFGLACYKSDRTLSLLQLRQVVWVRLPWLMCAGIAAYAAYGFGASHAGWAAMGGVFIAG